MSRRTMLWVARGGMRFAATEGMHAVRARAALFSLIVLGACRLLDPYACIYETRFIGTSGTTTVAGTGTTVVEYVNFRDYTPEAQSPTEIIWNIRGQDFVAAPVALTLRDARNPGQVVKSLSFSGSSATAFTAFSALPVPPQERDMVFALLNGHGILVVQFADGSSMTVPLTVTQRQDWHRPNCS